MSGERIKNTGDAKELLGKYHVRKAGHSDVKVHAAPKSDHSIAGTGMDGFEIDRDEMLRAQGQLSELREQLQTHLRTAQDLGHPLPDGTSKVAHTMRRAYRDRASLERGVQGVLLAYLAELDAVQRAIQASLQTYDDLDAAAASGVSRPAEEV